MTTRQDDMPQQEWHTHPINEPTAANLYALHAE